MAKENLSKLDTGVTVDLTIDGQKVTAPEGRSLYDVISSIGKIIPAMCYHYTFTPFGSCGMCLVEVEGKKAPVRSCTAPVQANMVVRTETPELKAAQKKALIRHLSTHPLDCPVCDADGHCELQDMAYEFGVSDIGTVKQKNILEDTRSIVLDFNMNRCILCGECINVCKEVQMVDALTFMKKDGNTIVTAHGDKPLYCEFCGDCLAVCPVGAITNKFSKYKYKPWQLKKTQTTCPYCGDGCQLILETQGDQLTRATSKLSWKSKWGDRAETAKGHGGTCGRGRFGFQFVNSPERLTLPLIRRDGELAPTPWLEALDFVAGRLRGIKVQHGSDAIAGLITARCTNEDIYLFQKLMRVAIGTNQIDSTVRYGQANFLQAMRRVGISRSMNNWEEITKANTVLVIGSNITETHPLTGLRVKEALRRYKATVIVAAPVKTNMAKLATHHLAIRPTSEGILVQGLLKAILEQGWADEEILKGYPSAIETLKQAVSVLSYEAISARTGIEQAKLFETAELFAKAERGVILCAEGITKQRDGYQNILNLMDLAFVSGKLSRPGSGLNALCEENNEQGAADMGALPDRLPGQQAVTDKNARARFSRGWAEDLPAQEGATLLEIIERARRGEIKALYLVGENPVGTLPASMKIAEALREVSAGGGFVLCQDPFLTETGRLADAVLPASTYAEKEGSFTNTEGKVQRVRRALDFPIGESKPDWQIFSELSTEIGYPLVYESADQIHQEIARLLPGYYARKQERPKAELEYYLTDNFKEETRQRYAAAAQDVGAPQDPAYPFLLELVPILYHSGKLSTQAEGLIRIYDKRLLQIGPADAERLGIAAGDRVRLSSPAGEAEVPVELNEFLPAGLVLFPEHFNDPPVKDLLSCEVDPITRVPYFKRGRVAIEKLQMAAQTAGEAEAAERKDAA
jgi:formate dehydrogenase (NADP+) alpha subunit